MFVGKRFASRTLLASLALASQVLFAQAPRPAGAPMAPAVPGAGSQTKPVAPTGMATPPSAPVGSKPQGPSLSGANQPMPASQQQQAGNGGMPPPNGGVPTPENAVPVNSLQPIAVPGNADNVPSTIRGESSAGMTLP